jgi:thymidylate kinase
MHPDLPIFRRALHLAGLRASFTATIDHPLQVTCYYRENPDGSIRWVWPSNARRAHFLRFYHASGTRSRLFCLLADLASRYGLGSLFAHGKFSWYASLLPGADWAWFSGTTGPDRKSILWRSVLPGGAGTFTKIAMTERAQANLRTEARQLAGFHVHLPRHVVLPQVVDTTLHCCTLTNIGEGTRQVRRVAGLPTEALQAWLSNGKSVDRLKNGRFFHISTGRLACLLRQKDERLDDNLLNRLNLLRERIDPETPVPLSAAHGDLTPWNVMVKEDRLHLVDLELGRQEMPLLFDLFHFVYQSNILIGNRGYKAIRAELDRLFARPAWQHWLSGLGVNVAEAERLYLFYIMTYYLELYHLQDRWHTQVRWLLRTWSEALDWHLWHMGARPARPAVLSALQGFLAERRYALLKWGNKDMANLAEDADLDMCIPRKEATLLMRDLAGHPLVTGIRIQRQHHMQHACVVLCDGTLIHLDLIHSFHRKALEFLDVRRVWERSQRNDAGLRIAHAEDDFMYTWLFHWLNDAPVPPKHQAYLDDRIQNDLTGIIRERFGLPVAGFRQVYFYHPGWKKAVVRRLQALPVNRGLAKTKARIGYGLDLCRQLFAPAGFIVTFSGVDGAGKSTVIDHTRRMIEKELRLRVVVLRHRPSLLPILSAWKYGRKAAEQRAAGTLPRKGGNKAFLSSIFRFAYYYADYLFGQWFVQAYYIRRGYVVLYDRYYFDFIQDSRRSNIRLPVGFVRWCYRFLLKPRMNFFLYADESVIHARKQELDPSVIRSLTTDYLALFDRLRHTHGKALYVTLENIHLRDTLRTVSGHIKHLHHEKAI